MPNLYRPDIPAGAKRGATLIKNKEFADHLAGNDRGNRAHDHVEKALSEYNYNQAFKAKSLNTLSNLTENLAEKGGTAFTAISMIAAAAAFGITANEVGSLLSTGKVTGNFSTPQLAIASIVAGGVSSLFAAEFISKNLRDFFRRDPAVEDAYKRLMAGTDPSLGRVFQNMLPDERAKASKLIGMLGKVHSGNTHMLQTEVRTLIDILNATPSIEYEQELDEQIEMVSRQLEEIEGPRIMDKSPELKAKESSLSL